MKLLRIAFLLLLFPAICLAQTRTIISEGSYNMGDGETPSVAESRALLDAKRTAVEQAGTYVESYSRTKNFQLSEDEVRVVSSGLMQVTILSKKRTVVGNGFRFWVKIEAKVNPEKMENMAARVKERSVVEDYRKIQSEYEKSRKEIAVLKKQLVASRKPSDKKRIEALIESDERLFQANEWFEKGSIYNLNHEHDQAIEAYTKAIALNPDYVEAYDRRGIAYYNKGLIQNDKGLQDRAVEDFKKVALLKPNTLAGAWAQGIIDFNQKKYAEALASFNKAINLDPESELGYLGRGVTYAGLKQFDQAQEDYTMAIAKKGFWQAISYQNRAGVYAQKGQYDLSLRDIEQAIALAPNNAQFYFFRGVLYALKRDPERAGSDFDRACKMGNKNGCEQQLALLAGKRLQGVYYVTGTDGVISQYSTRITFEMKNGMLSATVPPMSVAGMTFRYWISDVVVNGNVLTLKYRSQVDNLWSVSDMTADLTGGTSKIPCRWKQTAGNSGAIGKETRGYLIRADGK